MKLFVKRVGNVLVADGADCADALRTLPAGKLLTAEIKQSRNIQHHRLFFALCKRIGDGVGVDADNIATVFKLATGHYTLVKSKRHGELKIPKSISFSRLDQTGFRTFFDECVRVAFEEWGIEASALSDLLDPKTERHG